MLICFPQCFYDLDLWPKLCLPMLGGLTTARCDRRLCTCGVSYFKRAESFA